MSIEKLTVYVLEYFELYFAIIIEDIQQIFPTDKTLIHVYI